MGDLGMEKNEITCGICRDLMPSYCDGLLSDAVREAVEHHILNCEMCKAYFDEFKIRASQTESDDLEKEKAFIRKAKTVNYYMIGILIGALIPIGLLAALVIYAIIISL